MNPARLGGTMLDLKAKLAAAGLVSQADVERAEAEKRRGSGRGKGSSPAKAETAGLPVGKLKGKPKGEIYEAVRRWLEHVRLDPTGGPPSETARPFFFPQMTGRVGRLTIEPELAERLQRGEAGLIAFMSNHGLAHAVVPAAGARAVAELFPLWLRVLQGDSRAGQIEPKPEPKPSRKPESSEGEPA